MIQQRRKRWRRYAWQAWETWKEEFEPAIDDLEEFALDSDLEEGDADVTEGFIDSDFTEADYSLLEDIDLPALYTVFTDMADHEDEFLPDGRPRVEAVIARLRDMGLPGKVNRDDIDEAFAQWEKRR
jgi:hypothetical protein